MRWLWRFIYGTQHQMSRFKKTPQDSLYAPRQIIKQLVRTQVVVAIIVWAIFLVLKGDLAAKSALLGGLLAIAPNGFYAWLVFKPQRLNDPAKLARLFFIGEMLKLILIACLFVLIIKLFTISLLPLIVGLVAALSVFWLMPLVLALRGN